MAHAQKPVFVFRRKRRVHLNQRGRQFSGLLAAEMCASLVIMLDKRTPCSEVVCDILASKPIRQFPLHFSSRASPCAITFQLESTQVSIFRRLREIAGSDYRLLSSALQSVRSSVRSPYAWKNRVLLVCTFLHFSVGNFC